MSKETSKEVAVEAARMLTTAGPLKGYVESIRQQLSSIDERLAEIEGYIEMSKPVAASALAQHEGDDES